MQGIPSISAMSGLPGTAVNGDVVFGAMKGVHTVV